MLYFWENMPQDMQSDVDLLQDTKKRPFADGHCDFDKFAGGHFKLAGGHFKLVQICWWTRHFFLTFCWWTLNFVHQQKNSKLQCPSANGLFLCPAANRHHFAC